MRSKSPKNNIKLPEAQENAGAIKTFMVLVLHLIDWERDASFSKNNHRTQLSKTNLTAPEFLLSL